MNNHFDNRARYIRYEDSSDGSEDTIEIDDPRDG